MLLELKGVKKYFSVKKEFLKKSSDSIRAVDDVDLSIAQGEHLGLVGESGSGKTTLGRIILKLYPVEEGTIFFEGKDVTHLSNRQFRPYRKFVQMVFQDPYSSLDPRFTIRNVLKETFNIEKKYSPDEKEDLMIRHLANVELSQDCLNRFPHEFSGGERQRIAIARAMMMNPKLVILDEAVSSLDVLVQEALIKLLDDLQRRLNTTYLFISHNLRVVKKICHKIAVMYQGKIVELGATDEIFNNPLHPYTQELLLAALQYKPMTKKEGFEMKPGSRLVDKGNRHFVRA